MYGGIGMSTSSLHRESTDSLICMCSTVVVGGVQYLTPRTRTMHVAVMTSL